MHLQLYIFPTLLTLLLRRNASPEYYHHSGIPCKCRFTGKWCNTQSNALDGDCAENTLYDCSGMYVEMRMNIPIGHNTTPISFDCNLLQPKYKQKHCVEDGVFNSTSPGTDYCVVW